ncbi:putative RING-H2 finger protein ATL69 [Panicum miliaceum]|uniref:RING-H2 finger protein ATL69 n=1 Tax=Panicum miliaceum TaxID=4540 RepID=A0A3L6RN07_PANMI|nr:putative RING-H2 finger protein ATL69 [Panicum miliaceum]
MPAEYTITATNNHAIAIPWAELSVVRFVLVVRRCPVCLEEYEAKDVVRVLPACGHAFHAPCIDAWLRQHPTCPVCRASLRAKAGGGGNRAAPPDHSVLVAGAAAARAASSHRVPASSSEPPQAADTDGRLEIITEEPASPRDLSPADAAAAAGAGRHSPCAEAARQSGSAAGASEHC